MFFSVILCIFPKLKYPQNDLKYILRKNIVNNHISASKKVAQQKLGNKYLILFCLIGRKHTNILRRYIIIAAKNYLFFLFTIAVSEKPISTNAPIITAAIAPVLAVSPVLTEVVPAVFVPAVLLPDVLLEDVTPAVRVPSISLLSVSAVLLSSAAVVSSAAGAAFTRDRKSVV